MEFDQPLRGLTETSVPVTRAEFDALKTDVAEMRDDIKGLVKAWEAAGTLVSFVKVCAGLVSAITVIWAAITVIFQNHPPHHP